MSIGKRVLPDIKKRIRRLRGVFDTGILKRIFDMNPSACYRVFGYSNDNLGDLEWLHSIVDNGLHDDAVLGVIMSRDGLPIVSFVPDDYSIILKEENLSSLIEAADNEAKFIDEFHDVINAKPVEQTRYVRSEYFRLNKTYNEILIPLMPDELRSKFNETSLRHTYGNLSNDKSNQI